MRHHTRGTSPWVSKTGQYIMHLPNLSQAPFHTLFFTPLQPWLGSIPTRLEDTHPHTHSSIRFCI